MHRWIDKQFYDAERSIKKGPTGRPGLPIGTVSENSPICQIDARVMLI